MSLWETGKKKKKEREKRKKRKKKERNRGSNPQPMDHVVSDDIVVKNGQESVGRRTSLMESPHYFAGGMAVAGPMHMYNRMEHRPHT